MARVSFAWGDVRKLRYLVSLITKDNDYQMEQAASAKAAAADLGVDIDIVYAENDAITQSTQMLRAIQGDAANRPDGILVEPLGATPFPKVASAAVAAGIGWGLLNRHAEYTSELRRSSSVPVFSVSTDQVEVGRIQGRQIVKLLPKGGSVLYIQGPSVTSVSRERYEGLREIAPANIQLINLKGRWTAESAYQSVSSWLKLMTSQKLRIDLITAQNDAMAMGAKKAVMELATLGDQDTLSRIPVIGCDGVPATGQAWVRSGQMSATVVTPALTGPAIRLMTNALQKRGSPPEQTFTRPEPFPPLDSLKPQ